MDMAVEKPNLNRFSYINESLNETNSYKLNDSLSKEPKQQQQSYPDTKPNHPYQLNDDYKQSHNKK